MSLKNSKIIFSIYLKIFYIFSFFTIFHILFIMFFIILKIIFESNHISFNPYSYVKILQASIVYFSIHIFFYESKKISMIIISICFMSIFAIVLMDKFNLLVEYHEWIRRGMPEKPWM